MLMKAVQVKTGREMTANLKGFIHTLDSPTHFELLVVKTRLPCYCCGQCCSSACSRCGSI